MATSDIVEFARSLIRGDFAANDRYERKLDDAGWEGWPAFLSALFFLAIDRRFSGEYDQAKAIRLVADLRAGMSEEQTPPDPISTEKLIRAVFDPSVELDLPPEDMGKIQTLVAYNILAQEQLSDEELDELLAEAQELAAAHHNKA